jgi:hypothetical protein
LVFVSLGGSIPPLPKKPSKVDYGRFDAFLRERIFEPLGMRDTGL